MFPLVLATIWQLPASAQQPFDIDQVLSRMFAPGLRTEAFVNQATVFFLMLDIDADGVISASDQRRSRQKLAAAQRAGQVKSLIDRDFDGDGTVSRQEATWYERNVIARAPQFGEGPEGEARRAAEVERRVTELMRADTNGDGKIDWSEMIAYARQPPVRPLPDVMEASYRGVLAMDTNGDGKVTLDEFKEVVQERFARVDADGDGLISRPEFEAYWKARGVPPPRVAEIPPSPEQKLAQECAVPKADKADRLVIFNGSAASANSTVAIGSTGLVTMTARVTVEPGPEPLYLVLIAGQRMIWQIEGATDRVKHAVFASIAPYDPAGTPVGVTGLPAAVVTIAPGGRCGGLWVNMNARDGRLAERTELLFAHQPDAVLSGDDVWKLRLPSGQVTQPAEAEFHNSLKIYQSDPITLQQKTKMLHFAAVVSKIDPATVIAGQPVKAYETLPGSAGLLQLVLQGAIEHIQDEEFLVRRQISFPIELRPSHAMIFRVPKGVPAPAGNPGNSSVIIE